MEEVADVLKTKKLMTTVGLSHVKTMLKYLKGEDSRKKMPEETVPKLERPRK